MPRPKLLRNELRDLPGFIDHVMTGDAAFRPRQPVDRLFGRAHPCVVQDEERRLDSAAPRLAIVCRMNGGREWRIRFERH